MEPSYLEHGDLLIVLIKWLIAIIGTIGTGIMAALVWLGKKTVAKFNHMDSKLDTIQQIMMLCEGCSAAAAKYGRRRDDYRAEDDGSDQ